LTPGIFSYVRAINFSILVLVINFNFQIYIDLKEF